MKRLSITVRLTLLFILLLSVAGAGIVWTLYNGLASELKWRDDTTLINRTAQIKQLLIDGVNPDTLPVYFNRMMDVSQDILIIHGDSINKIVNRTNVGFAPIFPDICYHLTHYKPAAADIPVASDNPAHYADAIRYNARTPLQGSLLPLTRLVWA